jgi:hypothetical protein
LSAVTLADTGPRSPSWNAGMSGCATHDPLSIVRADPKAAWLTTRGPYVVDSKLASLPLAGK